VGRHGRSSAGELAARASRRAACHAFVAAFVGAVGLWWIYFDRSAEESARMIASSADPGRLGRSAYHFIHPVMIAGIIVVAAADERVLAHPSPAAGSATAWMALGGTSLFLAGHAAFKATVWRVASWPRLAGIAVLALLGLLAPHVAALTLASCAAAVVVGIAAADRFGHPATTEATSGRLDT
jgi:low temperature requirement protein LtrA